MTLNSSRLQLRPYSPEHLLALIEGEEAFYRSFGVRAAEGLHAFYAGGEVSPHWLAQLRDAREADVWKFGFAVLHRTSGLVIGGAGFKGAPDAEGMVEASYGVVSAFEGKGYATEVLRELVSFAFDDPRVRVIRAHTLPIKNASARVLEKNGFTHLGDVIDPEDGRVWRWERARLASEKPGPLIRVVLPYHLRNLARVDSEVQLDVATPVTVRSTLDALEARYPVLRGTMRDHGTLKRRPFIRFFACKEDLSLEPPEIQLPEAVVNGLEPFLVVGAMAGG